jgi:lysophospholipase L1-like esterase
LTASDATKVSIATVSGDFVRAIADDNPLAYTQQQLANSAAAMKNTIGKLRRGEPVKIVFWGDSITAATGASSKQTAFPAVTMKLLAAKFPKSALSYEVRGVPATSTSARLPSIENDVFALKPDLIIVEFLNDFVIDQNTLNANYMRIIASARAHNCDVVCIRPSSPSPTMYKLHNHSDFDNLPLSKTLNTLNANKQVALVNVETIFAQSDDQGLDRSQLMADPVHPNALGHAIYARTIANLFAELL